MIDREDRILGCLLGGAIGDAVGARFENIAPAREFHWPRHLRITDDTQLTLATCESILGARGIDPSHLAQTFCRWFRERRFTGIGSSTLKALTELSAGGHWALVGATGERAAGNGAAMRIAPLAFFLDPDIDADRQVIRDVCRITHRHDEAYLGALAVLRLLRRLFAGRRLSVEILREVVAALPDSRVRDRLTEAANWNEGVEEFARRFGTSGYVVESVPLAILAALNGSELLPTIEQVVRSGGDTDTIAALCGQLLGAEHGAACIPREMAGRIAEVSGIQSIASQLAKLPWH